MPCVTMKLAEYRRQLITAAPTHSSASITVPTPQRPLVAEVEKLDIPEIQPLFLPYQLGEYELDACVAGLAEIESRFRDGQLGDSLDKLRVHLHIRSRLVRFKDHQVRHQHPSTRARTKIDKNEVKVVALKEKYCAARAAKLEPVGAGPWENCWKVLADADISTLRGDDEIVGVGASGSKRTLSWIWMGTDGEGDASGICRLSEGAWAFYAL